MFFPINLKRKKEREGKKEKKKKRPTYFVVARVGTLVDGDAW